MRCFMGSVRCSGSQCEKKAREKSVRAFSLATIALQIRLLRSRPLAKRHGQFEFALAGPQHGQRNRLAGRLEALQIDQNIVEGLDDLIVDRDDQIAASRQIHRAIHAHAADDIRGFLAAAQTGAPRRTIIPDGDDVGAAVLGGEP